MKTLFIVHHVHSISSESDNAKLLGVYSSKTNAKNAIARFRQKPGFKEHPDGFLIDEYQIDKDYWSEGFISEE